MSGTPGQPTPQSAAVEAQLEAIREQLRRWDAGAALAELEILLPVVPRRGRFAFNLGRQALRTELRLAEAAFRVAVDFEPAFEHAYLNLGQTLWNQRETQAALGVIRDAALRFPDNPGIQARLGQFLLDAGVEGKEAGEAELAFREALRLGITDIATQFGLAEALRRQRRIPEAVAEFKIARATAEQMVSEDTSGRVERLFRRYSFLMFGEYEQLSVQGKTGQPPG